MARSAKPTGGPALKQAIHVARAKAGITSDMALAQRAHVHYDTLMNWYADRTVPRPAEVKKVADAMGIGYGELMAAWEGKTPEPPELHDAIRELVTEMRAGRQLQAQAVTALVAAITSISRRLEEPNPR